MPLNDFILQIMAFKLGLCNLLGEFFFGQTHLIHFNSLKGENQVELEFDILIPSESIRENVYQSLVSIVDADVIFPGLTFYQMPYIFAIGFIPAGCPDAFCKLCSEDAPEECTECHTGFELNDTTKKCDIPECPGSQYFNGE